MRSSRRTSNAVDIHVWYRWTCTRLDSILLPRASFVYQVGIRSIGDIDIGYLHIAVVFPGPLLFTLYVTSLAKLTTCFDAQHHQYADETYPYMFASKEELTRESISLRAVRKLCTIGCLTTALRWTYRSLIQFSIAQARYTKNVTSINVIGASISLSPFVMSLGVILDSHLTFHDHVVAVCIHIWALRHIRASIPDNAANMTLCSIVKSRLVYCNSLFAMFNANFCKVAVRPKYISARRNRNQEI